MPIIVPGPIVGYSQLIMYSVRSWWPDFFALPLSILALRGASFGVEVTIATVNKPVSERSPQLGHRGGKSASFRPGQRAGDSPAGSAGLLFPLLEDFQTLPQAHS